MSTHQLQKGGNSIKKTLDLDALYLQRTGPCKVSHGYWPKKGDLCAVLEGHLIVLPLQRLTCLFTWLLSSVFHDSRTRILKTWRKSKRRISKNLLIVNSSPIPISAGLIIYLNSYSQQSLLIKVTAEQQLMMLQNLYFPIQDHTTNNASDLQVRQIYEWSTMLSITKPKP